MVKPLLRIAALVGAIPGAARAHGSGQEVTSLWQAYTVDPFVLVPMLIFAALYLAGAARVWSRAGVGRGVKAWRVACFAGGMLALSLALVWPLDALGGISFAMHMAQHVTLTVVAAPLLVSSAPILTSFWAFPADWRRAFGGWGHTRMLQRMRGAIVHPFSAWIFYAAMLWSWHMPLLYQAAIRNRWIHMLEHVCFFTAALLLWWTVLLSVRRPTLGLGGGVFLLFTTGLQDGLLGAVLTFALRPLYAVYEAGAPFLGLSPLEDQQLAGILMWIPGGAVYLAGALLLTSLWLIRMENRRPATD